MEKQFWCNAQYVEDWLNNLQGFNHSFSAQIIGKGNRVVYLYILDINNEDEIKTFLEKYRIGESKYAKFYLTPNKYTKGNPFYVSIKKLTK